MSINTKKNLNIDKITLNKGKRSKLNTDDHFGALKEFPSSEQMQKKHVRSEKSPNGHSQSLEADTLHVEHDKWDEQNRFKHWLADYTSSN